jgi:sugar/nucleoside kinase (ribokinase family)
MNTGKAMAIEIAIVGEINLDLILYGLSKEMEVERELLASDFRVTLGSSSAILAHNLAALGTNVGFITRTGPDSLGNIALGYLEDYGVDLSRVVQSTSGTSTGITLILPHGRERHILTYPGTMFELNYDDLDLNYLKMAQHFHMSSLYLHRSLLPDVARLFREIKESGRTTSLDSNDDPDDRWDFLDEILPWVDVLFPNRQEACRIAGTENLEEAVEQLSRRVKTLVVKLGPDGALLRSGSKRVSVIGKKVNPVDTVGAGDSFNAGFLHQFIRGKTLEECLEFANLTGAYSTTASGGVEAFRDKARTVDFLSHA